MIKLIVYDLDGTLVDTLGDVVEAMNATFEEVGLPTMNADEVRGTFGSHRELLQRILPDPSEENINDIIQKFRVRYLKDIVRQSRPYPGLEEMLGHFETKGLAQAVLTNKYEKGARAVLQGLGLARYFDLVAGPDTYHSMKPDAGGLREIMKYHQATERQTVMVGDSETDILAAKAANVVSVAVSYGYRDLDHIRSFEPDYVVHSVPELSELLGQLS